LRLTDNSNLAGFDIAYGNGIVVAVFNLGAIKTSQDNGVTWQIAGSPTGAAIRCVTHGEGIFLAIDVQNQVLRSTDGLTWSLTNMGAANGYSFLGVTSAPGLFIAVGNSVIARSVDSGTTWTFQYPTGVALNKVGYRNGTFVAVGNVGAIRVSQDNGVSWQISNSGVTASLKGLVYGANKWVAVGVNGVILTASDGGAPALVPSLNIAPAVCLEWQSQYGALYQVQSSLNQQTWQDIGPSLTGDGAIKRFYDPRSGTAGFYRVQIK